MGCAQFSLVLGTVPIQARQLSFDLIYRYLLYQVRYLHQEEAAVAGRVVKNTAPSENYPQNHRGEAHS